jgi:hypothetical protein
MVDGGRLSLELKGDFCVRGELEAEALGHLPAKPSLVSKETERVKKMYLHAHGVSMDARS